MKRAALVLALVVAVLVAIFVALRGHDVAPDETTPRATDVVATGTFGRSSPRGRRVKDDVASESDAPVARRLVGKVTDATTNSEPIAGAEVLVAPRLTPVPREDVLDTELAGEPEFRTTTSADGTFGVDVPADGPWFVTARAAGCVDALTVASVGDFVRLRLESGVEKTFTVRRIADHAPIAGAEIAVYPDPDKGPPRSRCVSDERGEALIRVGSLREKLVVRARGYARAERFAEQADLFVVPGYRIAGVVRDRAGHGVAGAELRVDDVWTWRSDADGRFVLDELTSGREGRHLVEVKADSFDRWSRSLYCGDMDAVVELSRRAAVAGTVVLPDGAPAADAKVRDAKTDAAGAFRFAVESGSARLWANWTPAGGKPSDELFGMEECEVPDGGTVEGVVIRLSRKSFVPLRIVDATGCAVTDVNVRTKFVDDTEVRGDLVLVSVEGAVGTTLDLDLTDRGAGGAHWQGVHVAATTQATVDAAPVDVRLPALREFTATLLAPGGGALAAETKPKCTLLDVEAGWDSAFSLHAEAGSATWLVDPTKSHLLHIEIEGFTEFRRLLTPAEMANGRVAVRLETGVTVRGRVVAKDPNAVAATFAGISSADPGREEAHLSSAERGPAGVFRFDRVSAGSWRLRIAGWPMTVLVERPFQVTGEADVDLGDIPLPECTWVRGVVRTPDGRPCGGAAVQLRQVESPNLWGFSVLSQDDGSFSIYVPATGRGALLVSRRGFGAAVARLDGVDLASPLDVRLAPEGTLDIRIRLPHAGARFDWYVQTPDGAVRWQPPLVGGTDTLGFDERHECAGLAPGPLVVVIEDSRSTPPSWKHTANVTVVAGATTPVVVGTER